MNLTDKPQWLRKRLHLGGKGQALESDLIALRLHTICQEACCPNQGECFSKGVATFLILGNICTRDCRFCAVRTGRPVPPDPDEPARLGQEVSRLALRFAVVTSVTRDDLTDGGAGHFAETIQAVRRVSETVGIEVLIPDFGGSEAALHKVVEAGPQVLNHNLETVPRLYSAVRPQADYDRSLKVLATAKKTRGDLVTKSGLMVGLGEQRDEIVTVMRDLRAAGCDILTLGQYLRPSQAHHPVAEYVRPEDFEQYGAIALEMGFKGVASSPFVRSSYNAESLYRTALGLEVN